VVATAGTTLTGAVDPIDALADVCARRRVWLHVDGAYGLPAAAAPSRSPLFVGLARADSCSMDAHKWLYLPKACGIVLVKSQEHLTETFFHQQGYLPREKDQVHALDTTLEYSRPFRALKFWIAFRAYGAGAFRRAIERNLAQAELLYREVQRHDDLEALGPPELSIVPFRHLPPGSLDPDQHNRRLARALLRDGRIHVGPAVIDQRVYLRPCLVNYRTTDEDVRALIDVAREVGVRLADSSR
jgi:aromatic-L-amino-acid/L-tryptophan decarboxylase